MDVKRILLENASSEYREFTESLTTEGEHPFLGVRIPLLRDLARKLVKENGIEALELLSDDSFEEVMLQGFVIAYCKIPLEDKKPYIDEYLVKCDSWSLIDCFVSTFKFKKNDEEVMWEFLRDYRNSEETYVVRFVLVMMLNKYLKDEYIDEVLKYAVSIHSEEYYIEMAQAWLLATAAINYPEKVELILIDGKLNMFTHNKTIQKAVESFRISAEEKERLKKLRWK